MTKARTSSTRSAPPCGRPVGKSEVPRKGAPDQSWKKKLEEYLASKALNQSESRNQLVEMLFEQSEHFTIQELIKRIGHKYPRIGAATVYRNVPVLLDAGVIKETLTDDEGVRYYEVAGSDHHDHLVCVDCKRIFEFHDDRIERAQDRVSAAMKFAPVKHRHVIFAKCEYKKR